MDLELSDEQRWLSESVEALLARHGSDQQEVWRSLVDFGALTVGGDEGLGAIELCLIARGLGSHLAAVPYIGSAALRFATELADGDDSASLALLEPASGWGLRGADTTIESLALSGRKVAVEHAGAVDKLAVLASGPDGLALALVAPGADGVVATEQPSFDPTTPLFGLAFDEVSLEGQ